MAGVGAAPLDHHLCVLHNHARRTTLNISWEPLLRRADYLKKCNMSVTEDFSKSVREQRTHLAK